MSDKIHDNLATSTCYEHVKCIEPTTAIYIAIYYKQLVFDTATPLLGVNIVSMIR